MSGPAPAPRAAPIAAAGHTLALLESELNREILASLAARGPMTTSELFAWLLAGSRTGLGEHLEALRSAGAVATRGERPQRFALSAAGRELLGAVELASAWMASHPGRPLAPDSPLGWRAFETAAEGWRRALLEWIVRRSPTPAELAAEGSPALPGRELRLELEKLVALGAIELRRARDGERRYRLTAWGRRGIGVIAALAAWELRWVPERAGAFEAEDGIVLLLGTLPLLREPDGPSGLCALTVEAEPDSEAGQRAAALWARLSEGRVLACGEGTAPGRPRAWASGPAGAWLAAVVQGRSGGLRTGAAEDRDRELVEGLVGRLRGAAYSYYNG